MGTAGRFDPQALTSLTQAGKAATGTGNCFDPQALTSLTVMVSDTKKMLTVSIHRLLRA